MNSLIVIFSSISQKRFVYNRICVFEAFSMADFQNCTLVKLGFITDSEIVLNRLCALSMLRFKPDIVEN
jgi:hypothetical protein